jgi:molybdopterin molybdotransferase
MISVEEAQRRVLEPLSPIGIERVSLVEGLGRVLAEDVVSRLSHPPADVSSMDGYALRAADLVQAPASLTVIGESAAGHPFAGAVAPGQAVRIFTGAHLPKGADAVAMQEDCEAGSGKVSVRVALKPGNFIRPAGMDFAAGQVGLSAGRRLTARDIGLLASMNICWLAVRRRPKVAILSSGDELALPGDPVGPERIISSNSIGLCALVTALGGQPFDLGIAPDDPAALAALAGQSKGADLVVTSGGASEGDYDHVKSALGPIGLEVGFHKIAMRPGKPLIFGRLGDTPMLGLPGNPVSALVTAQLFLKPMLRALMGESPAIPPLSRARLGRDLGANDARQDYLRAALSIDPAGDWVATPFSRQDSAMMSALAKADLLVVRPPMAPPAQAGDWVPVLTLADGVLNT